jgi:hypothetical protein
MVVAVAATTIPILLTGDAAEVDAAAMRGGLSVVTARLPRSGSAPWVIDTSGASVSRCHALSASGPSHDSAVPERRVAGQADLCPAVAADTERAQLAAGHSIKHATADIVVVQLD